MSENNFTTYNNNNDEIYYNDYKWNKYKGKTVVLVEAEEPWYLNKDITTLQVLKTLPAVKPTYNTHANVEHFNILNYNNYILIVLCVILAILLVYKYRLIK
jgi:hypothetical protein